MIIVLPFPPSSLAGHNNGNWRKRDRTVATYRAEAFHLTRNELRKQGFTSPEGDIAVSITFVPGNNRGDRVNYPIRIKPQLDGIAEALGVNDKRFLPSYTFAEAEAPGRVIVEFVPICGQFGTCQGFATAPVGLQQSEAERCPNTARPISVTLIRSATDDV